MASRKGCPNKNKNALMTMLQKRYPGYDPILQMAHTAMDDVQCKRCSGTGKNGTDPCDYCDGGKVVTTLDQRNMANKEIASYVKPKLKAVEVSGDLNANVTASLSVTFVNADTDSK